MLSSFSHWKQCFDALPHHVSTRCDRRGHRHTGGVMGFGGRGAVRQHGGGGVRGRPGKDSRADCQQSGQRTLPASGKEDDCCVCLPRGMQWGTPWVNCAAVMCSISPRTGMASAGCSSDVCLQVGGDVYPFASPSHPDSAPGSVTKLNK